MKSYEQLGENLHNLTTVIKIKIPVCYSRSTNNKINRLHERALRFVYDDYSSSFDELLVLDNAFTVHQYNIQTLCIELYKVYNNLSQTVFSELFTKHDISYNLRSQSDFIIPRVKTVSKGLTLSTPLDVYIRHENGFASPDKMLRINTFKLPKTKKYFLNSQDQIK